MKDVKAKALNLKAKHHKTKEQQRQTRKGVNKKRLHKRNTRIYDKLKE